MQLSVIFFSDELLIASFNCLVDISFTLCSSIKFALFSSGISNSNPNLVTSKLEIACGFAPNSFAILMYIFAVL